MNRRNSVTRLLVVLGATVLIAAALLHLSDYPKDLSVVSASNLRAHLKGTVHALYFLVGWDWIVVSIVVSISAFAVTDLAKKIILLGGFAVLVNMGLMLAFMGWFIGTGMMLTSALMFFCGGLLSQNTAAKP